MHFKPTSRIAFAASLAISLTGSSYASEEPKLTQSEIVLTVLEQEALGTDQGGSAAFSIDMLRALPQVTIETTTIWTQGTHTFTGVPLRAFLETFPANDALLPTAFRATAANDYAVVIPTQETDDKYPIVAYEMDGSPMSLRGKGPLWIVYPYDISKKYRTEVVYSRSVWQLEKIELSR